MSETTSAALPCKLVQGTEGLAGIAAGVAALSRLVRLCYGPLRSRVLLERPFDIPLAVVSAERLCRDFELEDPLADIGARLVRELHHRTRRTAGDGTALATILLDGLLREGRRLLAGGAEPRALTEGLERAHAAVDGFLAGNAQPLERPEQRRAFAETLAGEPLLAGLLAEAVAEGDPGVLLVEPAHSVESSIARQEGLSLTAGYLSPLMARDTQRLQTRMERPLVALAACRLEEAGEVALLLALARQAGRPLLLLAEAVEGAALATLTTNAVQGRVEAVAVVAPGHGAGRRTLLEDLAALTGAELAETPGDLQRASVLGCAGSALVSKARTRILAPASDPARVRQRRADLERSAARWMTAHEREESERRRALLAGCCTLLRIGGASDPESGELLERAEAAVRAYGAARAGGVLPGGGAAFLQAAAAVLDRSDGDPGALLLRRVLAEPVRQLLANAGLADDRRHSILAAYAERRDDSQYDVLSGSWRRGSLVDSAAALRTALEVAVSVSALILGTGAVLVQE